MNMASLMLLAEQGEGGTLGYPPQLFLLYRNTHTQSMPRAEYASRRVCLTQKNIREICM